MKPVILSFSLLFTLLVTQSVIAQTYFTKNGEITFLSDTPIEKIEAKNDRCAVIVNFETGDVQAAALMRSFHFERALMEEHFNENYVESEKYPKALFKGQLADGTSIDLTAEGTTEVTVSGELTMHGVTKPVTVPGQISVTGTGGDLQVAVDATFSVKPEDYDIKIPSIVVDQIAKEITVEVSGQLSKK